MAASTPSRTALSTWESFPISTETGASSECAISRLSGENALGPSEPPKLASDPVPRLLCHQRSRPTVCDSARPDADAKIVPYRPPVGEWSPQSGLGSPETRFTGRTYLKGEEAKAPKFVVKGSTPKRSGETFKKTFTTFPPYKEDPWDLKIQAARERAAALRAQTAKVGDGKPFKPTSNDLAYRTSKNAKPAFAPMYSSSIVFCPRNLGR